jgi:hypothetical protein
MPSRRVRSLPSGRGPHAQLAGALGMLLALGCASKSTAPDASAVSVDAQPSDQPSHNDSPAAVAPNLDAGIGLGG